MRRPIWAFVVRGEDSPGGINDLVAGSAFGTRPPARRVGVVDWAASGPDAISQPLVGPENVVWWPYGNRPDVPILVFRGSGNAETGEFTSDGRAYGSSWKAHIPSGSGGPMGRSI